MKIDVNVVNKILSTDLLSKIGDPYDQNPCVSSLAKANKSIRSRKWENICLEEINNITGFLSVNYPEEYNLFWNKLVNVIKKDVIPHINNQLDSLLNTGKITDDIVDSVLFDIVNIIMAYSYKKYFYSGFYKELSEIYLDGHLPCGWKGKYPEGLIEVF